MKLSDNIDVTLGTDTVIPCQLERIQEQAQFMGTKDQPQEFR